MITTQLIAAYPIFGELSASSRRSVETTGRVRILSRGAAVIRKGDRVGGMYFVLSGRLRVFTISPTGDEAPLYAVDRGESCLLATSALLAEMLYPAWVEAESKEVKLFCVPAATFRTLYANEGAVRDFTLNVLAGRVFDLMAALEELSLHSIEDRVRNLLLRRANDHGTITITHEEIARSLGTAREVVTRRLKQLAERGLIDLRRGHIHILEPRALAEHRSAAATTTGRAALTPRVGTVV